MALYKTTALCETYDGTNADDIINKVPEYNLRGSCRMIYGVLINSSRPRMSWYNQMTYDIFRAYRLRMFNKLLYKGTYRKYIIEELNKHVETCNFLNRKCNFLLKANDACVLMCQNGCILHWNVCHSNGCAECFTKKLRFVNI